MENMLFILLPALKLMPQQFIRLLISDIRFRSSEFYFLLSTFNFPTSSVRSFTSNHWRIIFILPAEGLLVCDFRPLSLLRPNLSDCELSISDFPHLSVATRYNFDFNAWSSSLKCYFQRPPSSKVHISFLRQENKIKIWGHFIHFKKRGAAIIEIRGEISFQVHKFSKI